MSYRRDDCRAIVGRLYERLRAEYGETAIFCDFDIPFGVDFRVYFRKVVRTSDVVLAIIGPNWHGPKRGMPRIQEVTDPVRIELETSLGHRLLIPVLVDGASMPAPHDLPESLRDLAFINAAPVDSGRNFDRDVAELIDAIDKLCCRRSSRSAPARRTARRR